MALRNSRPCAQDCLPTFKLVQGKELFTDHAGLALVGVALEKFAKVRETVDKALTKRSGLSVGEIVTAYAGLLCTGKSDFDAIENHRQDGCAGLGSERGARSLDPAHATQHPGRTAAAPDDELTVALVKNAGASITPLSCGLVPLDIDVFAQDQTDLDVERPPSGKFASNDLILSLAGLAYNVLRLMSQLALASAGCARAPHGEAPAPEDGDTGIDLRERQGGCARTKSTSELWSPLPGVRGVRAVVWSVDNSVADLKSRDVRIGHRRG